MQYIHRLQELPSRLAYRSLTGATASWMLQRLIDPRRDILSNCSLAEDSIPRREYETRIPLDGQFQVLSIDSNDCKVYTKHGNTWTFNYFIVRPRCAQLHFSSRQRARFFLIEREKERKRMDIRYMYEMEEREFWYFDIELFDRWKWNFQRRE